MRQIPRVRRVVVVVLDGLRPDAIAEFGLGHLAALFRRGAATHTGATVAPSVTAACMASLLTGVPPEHHGLCSSRFQIPRPRRPVHPLPAAIAEAGLPASAFMCQVPAMMRFLAGRIARRVGLRQVCLAGRDAGDVVTNARAALRTQRDGLIMLHWPDCDDAGHANGWMSPAYGAAARRLDAAMSRLLDLLELDHDADTMLIALADHGGGGVVSNDHDSAHPLDRTIPIVVAGASAAPGLLDISAHLLDVPPTVLEALGVPVPVSYTGRALVEAFASAALVG